MGIFGSFFHTTHPSQADKAKAKPACQRSNSDRTSSSTSSSGLPKNGLEEPQHNTQEPNHRRANGAEQKPLGQPGATARLQWLEDGTHAHQLIAPSHQGLGSSLHEFMDTLFQKETAHKHFKLPLMGEKNSPAVLQEERAAVNVVLGRPPTDTSTLVDKWGTCQEVIGKGAFGKIRVVHRANGQGTPSLHAVKEFRKKSHESTKAYVQRVTLEWSMTAPLSHPNIIRVFDVLPLNATSPVFCQVMEYCSGGDIFDLILNSRDQNGDGNGLHPVEANCFFKQLMFGVAFLHSHGIAHRDLKPENLVLTRDGCLKISDFGLADSVRVEGDPSAMKLTKGIVGSEPYIPPEAFNEQEAYDPLKGDVWSCAIIYTVMKSGNLLWHVARKGEDETFDRYLKFRQLLEEEREKAKRARATDNGSLSREASIQQAREAIRQRSKDTRCDVLEGLEYGAKKLIYRMLDPNPLRRIQAQDVLKNEWFVSVQTCHPVATP